MNSTSCSAIQKFISVSQRIKLPKDATPVGEMTSFFALFLTKLAKKSIYQIGHTPSRQCFRCTGWITHSISECIQNPNGSFLTLGLPLASLMRGSEKKHMIERIRSSGILSGKRRWFTQANIFSFHLEELDMRLSRRKQSK